MGRDGSRVEEKSEKRGLAHSGGTDYDEGVGGDSRLWLWWGRGSGGTDVHSGKEKR